MVVCNMKLSRKSTLTTGEKLFTCDVCNRKFSHKHNLTRHMRTHTGEKTFACNVCNWKFSRTTSLATHMRTHTGEKPFTCNVCHMKFSHKHNLTRHMRTHTGEKTFACNVCNIKYSRTTSLATHMRTHTGEKPFTCNVCNMKFSHKHNLTRHVITHTGEKTFVCNVCNWKFSQKNHLTRHMRTHTSEKSVECGVCNKRKLRTKRTTHVCKHTVVKLVPCELCQIKFFTFWELDKHMKIHTEETHFVKHNSFICNLCKNCYPTRNALLQHKLCHATVNLRKCSLNTRSCRKKCTFSRDGLSQFKKKNVVCGVNAKRFLNDWSLIEQNQICGEEKTTCEVIYENDKNIFPVKNKQIREVIYENDNNIFPVKNKQIREVIYENDNNIFPVKNRQIHTKRNGKNIISESSESHILKMAKPSNERYLLASEHCEKKPELKFIRHEDRGCEEFVITSEDNKEADQPNVINEAIPFEEKPFSCIECGEKFLQKQQLDIHLITHGDYYRICCLDCGAKFKNVNSLIDHGQSCNI